MGGVSRRSKSVGAVHGRDDLRGDGQQYAALNAGASGSAVGIFGIAGDGVDALLNSGLTAASPDKALREKRYVGVDAFVVHRDGHAKIRKKASLWSALYRNVDGRWRGGVPNNAAQNKGCSRDWPEN